MKQQLLFDQEAIQARDHLRDLRGRYATPQQRDFTIREQRVKTVEVDNTRLKQTIANQERLINAMRLRMLQLCDTIRRYEAENRPLTDKSSKTYTKASKRA